MIFETIIQNIFKSRSVTAALTFNWVIDNQGSASKRATSLAIFGMVGQCGPPGRVLDPQTDQPWYSKGMWICAGNLFAAAVLTYILSLSLRYQNRKRDESFVKSDLNYVPKERALYEAPP